MHVSYFVELLYFEEVAKHSSFTKAAASFDCSISVVSDAVKRLEGRLGYKVFERTTRTVCLTPEGERLWLSVREHISLIRENYYNAIDESEIGIKSLTLNVPAVLRDDIVYPSLQVLKAKYPYLIIELRTDERIIEASQLQRVLTLRIAKDPVANYHSVKLARFEFTHVCSKSFIDRWGPLNSLHDLSDCPSVCYSYASKSYSVGVSIDRQPTNVTPRCEVISSDPVVLVKAALDGQGVLLAPRLAVQKHIASGDLIELFSGIEIEPKRWVYALGSPRLLSSEKVKQFLSVARKSLRDLGNA